MTKSNFPSVTTKVIILVEMVLLALHVFMFTINVCVNIWNTECPITIGKFQGWTNPDLLDLVWYASEWGYIGGMISLVNLLLAHIDSKWQKPAHILFQICFGFNVFVFTTFCVYIGPTILSKQIGFDYLEMTWVHILPICSSMILITMLDFVFLKKDAIYTFYTGALYFLINYIGTLYKGRPEYSMVLLSWKYPVLTIFISFCISCIMCATVYTMAILTQKIHGFDEKKGKWNYER